MSDAEIARLTRLGKTIDLATIVPEDIVIVPQQLPQRREPVDRVECDCGSLMHASTTLPDMRYFKCRACGETRKLSRK